VLNCDLFELGTTVHPSLHDIWTPEPELTAGKVGITSQFLDQAEVYHARYFNIDYFRGLISSALKGKIHEHPRVILDIGSGSGNTVLPCLELFPESMIIATDLSENLLAILRDYPDRDTARQRLALVCMDVSKRYFLPRSVDLVVGASILHHLIDPSECLRSVAVSLKKGGKALFFEPFEHGYAILRMAYEQILEHNEKVAEQKLSEPVVACFKALITDWKVRAGSDKSAPFYQQIDDKWLFTRSYFEEIAAAIGAEKVEIIPLNDIENSFRVQTEINLQLVLGIGADTARNSAPDWAWDIVACYDNAFSKDAKRDLPFEAAVLFSF
jgi:ubiquinone/menaquinone biosynthesis C-methylase UbiE